MEFLKKMIVQVLRGKSNRNKKKIGGNLKILPFSSAHVLIYDFNVILLEDIEEFEG